MTSEHDPAPPSPASAGTDAAPGADPPGGVDHGAGHRVGAVRSGLAVMLVGALVLVVGMVQTTAATPSRRVPTGPS